MMRREHGAQIRWLPAGLVAAITLQLLVMAGIYLRAQVPLWTGTEIRLKTVPVDPRSLLRGNYARLQYAFSELDASRFPERAQLRDGEVVYVSLKPAAGGLYQFAGASLVKPQQGPFLRGRVTDNWLRGSGDVYHVRYGIEAYFAPRARAQQLEQELREGGVAVVKVSAGGHARLKAVLPLNPRGNEKGAAQ
ncbi:GDYXXLXY domain-containing protein [Microbulbifer sp. SAOS-129_SWC]|uniref:GDYXXLXY domain-containing protein n=1 Tax=Microbulbifer sp. SAOS-129_SWC TaxID=3145235 RepID=UPI003217B566